jgi:hypothetical protein
MVANLNDRVEVESFLRNANANELAAERSHIQDLMASVAPSAPDRFLRELAARIAYELRFRRPQQV